MNCPHWLLALTIPFSRSDRARTCTAGVDAGCAEGLLRTSRRVSFSCRRALGGRSDGSVTVAGARQSVNASWAPNSIRVVTRDPALTPIVAGHPPSLADARPNGPVPSEEQASQWHRGGCGKPPCPPHATRCSEVSTGFPSPPVRQSGLWGACAAC